MYVYWATVENILNAMVARRTMIPYVLQNYSFKLDNTQNREQKVTDTFVKELNDLLPDIIDKETGRISVFAIALRAQAAFNKMQHEDFIKNEQSTISKDFTGYQKTENNSHDTYFTNNKGESSIFTQYLFEKAYELLISDEKDQEINLDDAGSAGQSSLIDFDPAYTDENGKPIDITLDPNNPNDSVEQKIIDNAQSKSSKWDKYKEYMLSELSEGAAFAIFNVEYTGSIGESFSNSFGSNPIESTFNSLSSKVRNISDLMSSAAGIPVVDDVMQMAKDTAATVLGSASFGLLNPLLALAYGVNVSMPKVWESSSATLPRSSYKIKLISPYGNAYSQLFNIYLPMAMIMAGSLPRSTGLSTHTFPFFCQMFDRGRSNIQLGMIESVSFTRGTSNLGFTRSGHPNAIDVDISVANLDEFISVDVSSNGVISKVLTQLSPDFSDTPFTTYLNSVTAVDVYSQIYKIPMLRLKLAERYMQLKSVISPDPAAYAAFTVNTVPFGTTARNVLGNNAMSIIDIMR